MRNGDDIIAAVPDETPRPFPILDWLVRGGAAVALVSLVLEFGFLDPARSTFALSLLHVIDGVVVAIFALRVLVRWWSAPDRGSHARRHWLELLLIGLLAAELLTAAAMTRGSALTRVYLVGAQVYLLAALLLTFLRENEKLAQRIGRPAWVLLGSFVAVIAVGTAALMLPNCSADGRPWRFVDALFTATSATCVTGLTVRDTGSELSFRGQAVILVLIQIGGLGLVTLAMFMAFLRQRSLRLSQSTLAQEVLGAGRVGEIGRFLGFTLAVTLVFELLGAAGLFFARDGPAGPRAWWAAFHSVSAFCNAGFGLDPSSLMAYSGSWSLCMTVAALILLGGVGYPVLLELARFRPGGVRLVRRWRWTPGTDAGPLIRLSLHARLVLVTSLVLVAAGALLFYLMESRGTLAGRPAGERVLASLFQSITTRTAGFNTVDIGTLQVPTLLLVMALMAIGAAPVSTGGGVKATTAAILFLTFRSMLRNRDNVEAFGRTIPRGLVNASVAVIVLYGTAVMVTAGLLAVTQPADTSFLALLFESVSALSTVGLSTGVTPKLNDAGKLVLCAAMLVGRVGPLAIVWTVLSRPPALRYEYPQEPVIVS